MKPFPLILLYTIVFFSYLGFSLPFPLLLEILDQISNNQSHSVSAIYSALMLSYGCGQILGSTYLGKLSDKFNKKNILTYITLGSSVSYIISGYATHSSNLPLLILGRFLNGFNDSTLGIIQALIGQNFKNQEKINIISKLNSAATLGWIIGPFTGGLLGKTAKLYYNSQYAYIFYISSITAFSIASLTLLAKFVDTTPLSQNKEAAHSPIFKELSSKKELFFISFLSITAFSLFQQYFPFFLQKNFLSSSEEIGFIYSFLSACWLISQYYITPKIADPKNHQQILKNTFLVLFITYSFFGLSFPYAFIFLILPIIAIASATNLTLTVVFISDQTPTFSQGKVLGLNRSVQAMAKITPSIIGSFFVISDGKEPILLAALLCTVSYLCIHLSNKDF